MPIDCKELIISYCNPHTFPQLAHHICLGNSVFVSVLICGNVQNMLSFYLIWAKKNHHLMVKSFASSFTAELKFSPLIRELAANNAVVRILVPLPISAQSLLILLPVIASHLTILQDNRCQCLTDFTHHESVLGQYPNKGENTAFLLI